MKTNLISALIFLVVSICGYSQVWQQTASTPEGSGVTEMVVRQINGQIFVTTGSFNWPNGDMGGVRRSTDDGATWENVSDDVFIARTIIDAPDGNLYASIWDFPQDEGLYRSTDNGNSWETPLVTVPSGDNIFSIAVSTLTTPNTIFAGTRNGPLRSTDNGVNWAPATNGIPGNSWVRDIDVDSAGVVVAATTNGVFFSIDNGDLWQETTGIAQGDTIVKLIFDYPLSTEKAGGSTRLLGGSDDGNIYEAIRDVVNNEYLLFTLLAIIPGSEFTGTAITYLLVQNLKMHGVSTFPEGSFGGGFYLSSDNGASWNQNNSGLPSNPKSSALSAKVDKQGDSQADVHFYIGFFENVNGGARIYKITYNVSSQQDWTAQSSGTTNDLHGVSFTDANTGTVVGSFGTILRTTDGGTNWTPQSSGTTWDLLDVSFTDASTGTAVGFSGTILGTTNGGTNWTLQSSGTMNNLFGVSFTDANTGTAVGQFGTILHTTDGGINWTSQSGTAENLRGVSFTDANTGTAVGTFGTILRTSDGGTNWTPQSSGTSISLTGISFTDANTGTVVGLGGTILSTTDGGASWTSQSSGTTNQLDGVSFTDANTGTAVGLLGTILRTSGGTTWVQENGTSQIPNDFALKQNYPNPFNPSTNIEYSIPSESFVELKVYDLLGNEVATLVDEQQQAGVYRADFTADNLPSGMYFARITANEFTQVVKMILLK